MGQNPAVPHHTRYMSLLRLGTLGDLLLPLPPLDEQRAIAEFLEQETANLTTMVARAETAIERLQEYRTALITAAVTGKVDVRE